MQGIKYSVWTVKVGYPSMIRVLIYVGGVYIKEVISNSEWVIPVNNDGQPFAIYDIFPRIWNVWKNTESTYSVKRKH